MGPLTSEDEISRVLRRQQWSALNVPLMWAAADGDRRCAVLKWLASRAEVLRPVNVGGEKFQVGWQLQLVGKCSPLRCAVRIQSKEDLSERIHNQGFSVLGEHISVAGCRSESGTP